MRAVRWLWCVSYVVIASAPVSVGAQPQPDPSLPQPREASRHATLAGCLAQGDEGRFVLRNARIVPDTDASATSSAAGTSATGEAASGSVTGKTPTGSTATETASPTPAVGTPGASANPASPTYNRPATAGTTGSVARPDSSSTAPIRQYVLIASPGIALRDHLGRAVEVSGSLSEESASGSAAEQTAEIRGAERKAPAPAPAAARRSVSVLTVLTLRDVAPSCSQP